MKKLSLYLVLALLSYSIAQTQSSFPDCQGNDYTKWKNCYGKATFPGGDIYVGEFSYIGENVILGDNVKIYPNCFIGDNVTIDHNTNLFPASFLFLFLRFKIGS